MSDEIAPEPDDKLPFALDFTPGLLGKKLGEARVLPWLLETARRSKNGRELQDAIQKTCLGHIQGGEDVKQGRNQRDMASHVVQALRNYGLIQTTEGVTLTAVGKELLAAPEDQRDILFARHILTACNGYRLVEEIERMKVLGKKVSMEDLARKLDRDPTAKSLSSARAWLARGGVLTERGRYDVLADGFKKVLGEDISQALGLSPLELELVLAARALELSSGKSILDAPAVADVAEERADDLVVPRKPLNDIFKRLALQGVMKDVGLGKGSGGSRGTYQLDARFAKLSDQQLRKLLKQVDAAFDIRLLKPISELRLQIESGNKDVAGKAGEMLAVHLCLLLGLKVLHWRKRAPHSEIDLIAERSVALAIQRWAVQVKNLDASVQVNNDTIDREIGAAAGTGTTHVLFVNPRGGFTEPARREMLTRARLTSLHIYYVGGEVLRRDDPVIAMLDELKLQMRRLAMAKRDEAERREN